MNPFIGNTYIWFTAIVENVLDPLNAGRVQIRCVDIHSDSETDIPVSDLLWAQPLLPITSASSSGVGQAPVGLVEGSWVSGYFLDSKARQYPILIGSIPGIPLTKFDHDWSEYPKQVTSRNISSGSGVSLGESTFTPIIDEPDSNRLARNESIDQTIVKHKKDTIDKNITIAFGGQWSEPETPYDAKYPFNSVSESRSGHISEVDDTPGAERLHNFHRTGTFDEVHPDGSKVQKILGDSFNHVNGDDHRHSSADRIETIEGDFKVFVRGNGKSYYIEVGSGGDLNVRVVKGDVNLEVQNGNVNKTINGNVTETITGNVNRTVGGVITETASNHKIKTGTFAIDGDETITGTTTGTSGIFGDVIVEDHIHTGVIPGGGTSGPPVK